VLEIPNHVTLTEGAGGLPKVCVKTATSTAVVYLHGAHVTHFQRKGEEPLLFMSVESDFSDKKAIRGGIPIIYPWFGPRENFPAHGIARTSNWELVDSELDSEGVVSLRFRLPSDDALRVEYIVRVGRVLSLELKITNRGNTEQSFETCLHTYFQIGSIDTVSVAGLAGCAYFDKVAGVEAVEESESIRFGGEVDRVYRDGAPVVEIIDPTLDRKILVKKSGSKSTVVWNPWIKKSRAMADFGDDEYLQMVCVESGNIADDRTVLPAGATATLKVELSSEPLTRVS
jgi:glucose-6-phosphate 1-epimerase